MALLSVIRRWFFRDQLSIREIARRTGLSRNTIRKYLRSDVVEPKFKVPDRPRKLDAFAGKLSAWLKIEASRAENALDVDKRVTALQTEVTESEEELKRLYRMVEEGVTNLDDILKDRLANLKLDRDRAKTALDRIKSQVVAPTALASAFGGHGATRAR